jgi:hypothetical protein
VGPVPVLTNWRGVEVGRIRATQTLGHALDALRS